MYLAQKTMPELFNAVRELALHMDAPGEEHVKEMGRVVGYAKQVKHKLLVLRQLFEIKSISETSNNYAADETDQRRVTKHIHTLELMITNCALRKQKWSYSQAQRLITLQWQCAQESKFTCMLIVELTEEEKVSLIYVDDVGSLLLADKPQVSQRTKHISIQHHFLRKLAE